MILYCLLLLSVLGTLGLSRDGRNPVHGLHPPPVLHLARQVLRDRQQALALLPKGHDFKASRKRFLSASYDIPYWT